MAVTAGDACAVTAGSISELAATPLSRSDVSAGRTTVSETRVTVGLCATDGCALAWGGVAADEDALDRCITATPEINATALARTTAINPL